MASVKRNNLKMRAGIIGLSALASIGIWAAVAKAPHSSASAVSIGSSTQVANSSFSPSDSFLTPSTPQYGASSTQYYQPAPAPRFQTRAS